MAAVAVTAAPEPRQVHLVVGDDLRRSRLTVLFRLLLAIPHLIWVVLWGIAVSFVGLLLWLSVLFVAEAPEELHNFVARYLRYATHVSAYVYVAANPYPGFLGRPGYPVDLEIAPPVRQSRWSAGLRLFLSLPAFLLATTLGAGFTLVASGFLYFLFVVALTTAGAAGAAGFLAWFASLALGRSPRGLRDLTTAALGYGAQTGAYLFLLTERYPNSDPALAEEYSELPEHPVQVVAADDLGRPRLTVLFRLLLTIPHSVWLLLWSIAAFLAVIAAWFATLATGRTPHALHRFLAAYTRYETHVGAFLYLVGRRFPGFTGRAGSYGIDLEIAPPAPQNRWKTGFRLFLAIPAIAVSFALEGVLLVIALLAWFYALVTGRMPEGVRNLGVSCLRYGGQLLAYVLLVTDRYPYAAPVLEGRPAPREPEPIDPLEDWL